MSTLGGDTATRRGNMLMKTNEEPRMRAGGLRFVGWLLRAFAHPIFTPEADERRFLAGLPIALFVIIFPMGRGWLQFLGPYPGLVIFALWWTAYLIKFRTRLKSRGELKRAIIAPGVFVALLLGVGWY
jgi:hypothetical protein